MTAKDMLADVLRRAVLTTREREDLESVWDWLHRSRKGASNAQKAWIEKVYYGQQLDRAPESPMRRRVVIPTWQKSQPQPRPASDVMRAPVATAPAPIVAAVDPTGPGLVKTNARLIRRKSGAFRAVVAPSVGDVADTSLAPSKVGYINYPVKREALVTSLLALEEICPQIEPGSRQYEKIARFFERGGIVLKVKPLSQQAQQVA